MDVIQSKKLQNKRLRALKEGCYLSLYKANLRSNSKLFSAYKTVPSYYFTLTTKETNLGDVTLPFHYRCFLNQN